MNNNAVEILIDVLSDLIANNHHQLTGGRNFAEKALKRLGLAREVVREPSAAEAGSVSGEQLLREVREGK